MEIHSLIQSLIQLFSRYLTQKHVNITVDISLIEEKSADYQ